MTTIEIFTMPLLNSIMQVAIFILNWNGLDVIPDCLKSIECLRRNSRNEIIVYVIDNGSKDKSKDYIRENWKSVKMIENEFNIGVPAGMNQALSEGIRIGSDFVFITNNDVIFDSDSIDHCVEHMGNSGEKVIAGPVILDIRERSKIQSAGGLIHRYPLHCEAIMIGKGIDELQKAEIECDYLGVFMMRTKEIKDNRMDESFFAYWEDCDFNYRMKKKGFRILVYSDFRIWHYGAFTTGKISGFQEYHQSRNKFFFARKNLGPLAVWFSFYHAILYRLPFLFIRMLIGIDKPKIVSEFMRGTLDGIASPLANADKVGR